MADTIDHDHGSTGNKPPSGLNFSDGEFPNPEVFDWFWNQTVTAVNDHTALLEQIDSNEDGVVDEAESAQSADTYKGNDIDNDGDGKVNAAETADSAKTYKGNDIDSDGDGKVDVADEADNATTVKGNDIDSDGDGKVDAADTATGLTGVSHAELTDAPTDAHHSREHGANQHNTDDLHNDAVTVPSYATKSDVPSLAEGQMVYIENDNAFYFEDGT